MVTNFALRFSGTHMKLILITTPEYFVEEDQILNALFEEGLDILHLRKPGTEAVYAENIIRK